MAVGFKKATVNASDVAATLSDYPSYVDLSRLGITTLAEAQSVRVYADEAKTTEWAREIVSASEMHVKVPSLTSTTDIYVDYDGVRADYATSATYGRNAVWVDYGQVAHLGTLNDSTANGLNFTGSNYSFGTGNMGGSAVFNGSSPTSFTTTSGNTEIQGFSITITAWIKTSASTIYIDNLYGGPSFATYINGSGQLTMEMYSPSPYYYNSLNSGITVNNNVYRKVTASVDAGAAKLYLDGALVLSGSLSNKNVGGGNWLNQGSKAISYDEVRVRKNIVTADWETTEYNNQSAEATFWGTWTDATPPAATVKAIPVNAAKVAATLSDYPALVIPSEMTGWGTLTLAEAQSLRFYSDEALTTELAREVVSADEIHVKVPSLTTSTTIYASYNGTDADYATSATYGRNAVWSDYTGVFHLEGITNSTGATNLTNTGGITFSTNKIGNGADGGNSTSKYLKIAETMGFTAAGNSTWNFWYTPAATTGGYVLDNITVSGQDKRLIVYEDNANKKIHMFANGNEVLTSAYTTGIRYKCTIVKTGTSWQLFWNGVSQGTTTTGSLTYSGGAGFSILNGLYTGGTTVTSSADEVRTSTNTLSANWITTEYNNQSDVGTFWGTVTDAGGGTTAAKNPLFTGGGI